MMIPNLENINDMNSVEDLKNNLDGELAMSVNASDLSPYVNGENNENLNISNSINYKSLESSFDEINFPLRNSSDNLDLNTSPDIFDDTSPKNISRYGRARKPKVITDIYAVTSRFSPKGKLDKSKTYQDKLKSPNCKNSPEKRNNIAYDNSSKSPVHWNKSQLNLNQKVYVRKDLIQMKDCKEQTLSLMRNMFSPVKNDPESSDFTPEESVSPSHSPLDKIILKKSPNGIFELSPKKSESVSTVLNFDAESDCNKNNVLNDVKVTQSSALNSDDNISEEELSCGWLPGQLAWARVTGHPFWPCLVTRDSGDNRFVRKKIIGRASLPTYSMHVTFFGDNGRHCWLTKSLLMTFLGLDDFNMLKEGLTPELKKKDPKYCASFEVKAGKEGKWLAAVSEAELYLRRPIDMREDILRNSLTFVPQLVKKMPKERKKDVSLSSSIFDSLFNSDNSQSYDSVDKKLIQIPEFNENSFKPRKSKKKTLKGQTHLDSWVTNKNSTTEKVNGIIDSSFESEMKSDLVDTDDVKKESFNKSNDSDFEVNNLIVKHELNGIVERKSPSPIKKSENAVEIAGKSSECEIKLEQPDADIDNNVYSPRKTRRSCDVSNLSYQPDIKSSTPIGKRKRKSIVKIKENDSEKSDDEESIMPDKLKVQNNVDSINNPKYKDADFIQFMELKRDAFMDENPDFEEADILAYLYKVWQYGESQMLDELKGNSVCLVKGMVDDVVVTTPPKRTKRVLNDDNCNSSPISHREKTSRKNKIKSYFSNEPSDSSDTEFESNFVAKPSSNAEIKYEKHVDDSQSEANKSITEIDQKVVSDRVDVYMEALKKPKPNIFKGLLKEKVCEICELPTNLIKCKGLCQGMFHITCVELQKEQANSAGTPIIKKRRKRGRAKKLNIKKNESTVSVDCSLDNTNDLSTKDNTITDCNDLENDQSIKNETSVIAEPYTNGDVDLSPSPKLENHVDDAIKTSEEGNAEDSKDIDVNRELPYSILNDVDDFEAKMAEKMMELIENDNSINVETASVSSEECDWDGVEAGECVIVDYNAYKKKINVESTESPQPDPEETFKCNNCVKYDQPPCFVCKSVVQPKTGSDFRQRCNINHCHHFYHPECLKAWPQTKYSAGGLIKGSKMVNTDAISCPRHVCHTCVSDDPQGCKTRFSGVKLARCVRCPATYHSFTQCVPAGTKLITASQVICPRHCDNKSGKTPYHVNTAWCFICAKGGTLVCCDTCPTSFHAECLNIPLPEGGYICEDCETGRLPLYGELVWVKLGQYRWWPALVLHPSEIPNNIYSLPHLPGQFAVRFFGMYDHFWVNSGRVFPYQEGDTGNASSRKSAVDTAFYTALIQAQQAYTIIKGIKSKGSDDEELISSLLPPKYVKLKVNRAIGNAVIGAKAAIESGASKCECNPNSERPCAPDSYCLNRMLLTECSPSVCAAGDRCCNQAFEKRLYPPLEPSRTAFRGWGLKTLADIKKGEFVIEYVGEVINEEEFQRRMQRRQEVRDENYYFLTLDKDRMIDAGPKGNVARFMNHSCEPNCETQKWTVNGDVRVGLFALDDIPAGSEVTFNYNLACAGDDKKKCLCGTKRCAGYIGAKPLQEEPPPKKPRRTPLKRKYRRKVNNVTPQSSGLRKVHKKRGRPVKKLPKIPSNIKGIERDLAIINQALLECSNDENSNDLDEKSTANSDFNESVVDNTIDDESKTEITGSDDDKKIMVKRKRTSKPQEQYKSDESGSSPVNKNKRARSNSVQFNNSVTLIDENDVVTIINDEQNSNESFKVLKLNGDVDYDVKEVSYVVNESTI